jgi:hypothetical protein
MTRRRALCGLVLLSAVLACFGGWLWIVSGPRMTKERFEQVKKQVKEGMSKEEVIRMVGEPPATHRIEDGCAFWFCDDAVLTVYIDTAGTVTYARVDVSDDRPPTLTERIRRWLGL